MARADILQVDDMIGKLREVAGEEAARYIEAIDLQTFDARDGALSSKIVKQKEVFGQAYTDLATFVEEQEKSIVVTARELGAGEIATLGGGEAASRAPMSIVAPAGRRSFENDMVLESRQRGTDAPEWAWVRRVNLEKWQMFENPNPTPAAQSTGAVS